MSVRRKRTSPSYSWAGKRVPGYISLMTMGKDGASRMAMWILGIVCYLLNSSTNTRAMRGTNFAKSTSPYSRFFSASQRTFLRLSSGMIALHTSLSTYIWSAIPRGGRGMGSGYTSGRPDRRGISTQHVALSPAGSTVYCKLGVG